MIPMGDEVESFALEPFDQLTAAEPTQQAAAEVERWVETYSRLVAMLDRHLAQTRALADSSPDALRRYLDSANMAILREEHERFTKRLAMWKAQRTESDADTR